MNFDFISLPYPFPLILVSGMGLCIILSIISIFVSIHSKNKISRILNGKNSKDIDEVLMQIYKNISVLDQFRSKTTSDIGVINTKLARSIQSVETLRFNPFKGTGAGGNQSFATALLDERGDGVIISTLYSSDRMSVFAKPVVGLASTFELTEEEKEVLGKASVKLR